MLFIQENVQIDPVIYVKSEKWSCKNKNTYSNPVIWNSSSFFYPLM